MNWWPTHTISCKCICDRVTSLTLAEIIWWMVRAHAGIRKKMITTAGPVQRILISKWFISPFHLDFPTQNIGISTAFNKRTTMSLLKKRKEDAVRNRSANTYSAPPLTTADSFSRFTSDLVLPFFTRTHWTTLWSDVTITAAAAAAPDDMWKMIGTYRFVN